MAFYLMLTVKAILLMVYVLKVNAAGVNDVMIKTNVGTLIGMKKDVTLSGTKHMISEFLGIPYAEPPVGKLRFRFPLAKAPFNLEEPRVVQEFGPRCMEEIHSGSDNCLTLNIYVPERNNIETLAVMVYIHGGGFYTSTSKDYNPEMFAVHGHVIVVTFNYRLSVWGFLSTGDSNSIGNYGLWDQRLAIEWVKDNIRAFGGDTSRITIFGQSAGAASAIYQGTFPANKGQFQRIIAQSGSASSYEFLTSNPKPKAERLATAVGCRTTNTAGMIECLRALPTSTIQSALTNVSNGLFQTFRPIVDNVFVTCRPADILNTSKTSKLYKPARETFASFEILTGMNAGEGGNLFEERFGVKGDPETFEPSKAYFDSELVPLCVNLVYKDRLPDKNRHAITAAIIEEYTDHTDPQNPHRIREQFEQMHTDSKYRAPLHATIDTYISTSTKKIFVYNLNIRPSHHVLSVPSWFKKASHFDDLIYIFPPTIPLFKPFFDDDETEVAKQMIQMWTNFAKTGNPNTPMDIGFNWPPYTSQSPRFLDITRKMISQNVKIGLGEEKAEFWNTIDENIVAYPYEECKYDVKTSSARGIYSPWIWLLYLMIGQFTRATT